MRTRLPGLIFCACFLGSCDADDDGAPTVTLNTRWQMYSNKVLVLGGTEACAYKTKPSDMAFKPTNTTCQDDDIYDFSSTTELVIEHGTRSCSANEPASATTTYERQGGKLVIGGREHTIVQLTRDTLILDVCLPLAAGNWPTTSYGKVGMKLARIK
ncbi:hypothetical protein [Rufibacter hautae]|uniref:Lipocalin-like domain-containing protein n=1 Tax=Rufibacter hautae TaxID=2595005 RepID=A0A5B6TJY4_9BACT|nr:hypothetical protein [Rufibacter hautae]KAA3440583.1 hypothetical protein FOA19_08010 [Rufibacter hautae]